MMPKVLVFERCSLKPHGRERREGEVVWPRERAHEASHLPGRITLTMALTLLIGTSAVILPSAALRPRAA